MTKTKPKVLVVVGAQYGSEGKGVVVHRIATTEHFDFHVRTGGPNAGHSFVHNGEHYVVQSVPCGFVDPNAKLVLGAGAVINPRVLRREIEFLELKGHSIRPRLYIDCNATVLSAQMEILEGHTAGEMHKRIGSTGEGVGEARIARVRRNRSERVVVSQQYEELEPLAIITDTTTMLSVPRRSILLEGTQGSGLSLVHGPWPYCTSADTNAAQFCADAGVSPLRVTDVMLVARTMPIRVAGNSGPLEREVSWDDVSARTGKPTEERTTVTKKVRRVAEWDDNLFTKAVVLNSPTHIAVTFLDYVNPKDSMVTQYSKLSQESRDFIERVDRLAPDAALRYAGTGVDPIGGWQCVEF